MDTKLNAVQKGAAGKHYPEQLSLPREMNCSRASIDPSGIDPNASGGSGMVLRWMRDNFVEA